MGVAQVAVDVARNENPVHSGLTRRLLVAVVPVVELGPEAQRLAEVRWLPKRGVPFHRFLVRQAQLRPLAAQPLLPEAGEALAVVLVEEPAIPRRSHLRFLPISFSTTRRMTFC